MHESLAAWRRTRPLPSGDFHRDAAALAAWHEEAALFLPNLATTGHEAVSGRAEWRRLLGEAHAPFIRDHLERIVGGADCGELRRCISGLAAHFPWLVPTPAQCAEEEPRPLRQKIGFDYKAAVLLSEWLAHPAGRELVERAREPGRTALSALEAFQRHDQVDLGAARISRKGVLAFVEISSAQALNAEDESVLDALEACVDVALLDDRIQLGVLRGAPVQNAKYRGRRVFCSGINLTELYEGRLSYLYYMRRELGLVSKLYRGLHLRDRGTDVEKPWLAAVDTHAIGGGFQLLLVMDYVIAERGSVLRLPAQTEGIVPGAANLRLPRFMSDRMARQFLLMDRPMLAESDEGRFLVDEVASAGEIESRVLAAAKRLLCSGLVSIISHRKALRVGQEPIQQFQAYMCHFALAQADCHFGPSLVENLERGWVARRERHGPTHRARGPEG